jgi:hypothetical protein
MGISVSRTGAAFYRDFSGKAWQWEEKFRKHVGACVESWTNIFLIIGVSVKLDEAATDHHI